MQAQGYTKARPNDADKCLFVFETERPSPSACDLLVITMNHTGGMKAPASSIAAPGLVKSAMAIGKTGLKLA